MTTVTGVAADLAELVQSRAVAETADRHADRVWRALIDTVAVAIAAEHAPETALIRRYALSLAGKTGASDWLTCDAYPAEHAAMLNASVAHVLDYDDVCSSMRLHPSVVLLPAVVALAEEVGADGRQCAVAYVAGYEVLARLVSGLRDPMFARGWHGTSIFGTVGSAAACSRLLGLSVQQTRNALALAVAFACGTRESFGSTAKCLQVGTASASGLKAARLAALGATGGPEPIVGAAGLVSTFAGVTVDEFLDRAAPMAVAWSAMDEYPEEPKRYPSCLATHAAIDCALELRERVGATPEDIFSVSVATNPTGLAAVPYLAPQDALQARFSMTYTVAAALSDGRVGLQTFDDGCLGRAAERSLAARVNAVEIDQGQGQGRWTSVEIRTADGVERTERRLGDDDEPEHRRDARLRAKLDDCLAYVNRSAAVGQLFEDRARAKWTERPVAELIERLRPTTRV